MDADKEILKEFYRDIQSWIDGGFGPNKHGFVIHVGLCLSLKLWLKGRGVKAEHSLFIELMREQFKAEGLDELHPFNCGMKFTEYALEAERGLVFINERRLNWIKEHAK